VILSVRHLAVYIGIVIPSAWPVAVFIGFVMFSIEFVTLFTPLQRFNGIRDIKAGFCVNKMV
jgi:hypothetical protein